jgi:small subunit ribosomal protein S10
MKARIFFQAFSSKNLKKAVLTIKNSLSRESCKISQVTSMPLKKKTFCVLRSPHVNKDSRETFQLKIYKKLIDIVFPNISNFSQFLSLCVPSGVLCKINLISL